MLNPSFHRRPLADCVLQRANRDHPVKRDPRDPREYPKRADKRDPSFQPIGMLRNAMSGHARILVSVIFVRSGMFVRET